MICESKDTNLMVVRNFQEIQNMMKRGSKMRWGNEIGYTILPIQLSGFEDPLQCVREVKKLFDKKKLSSGPLFSYRSGSLVMKLSGVEVILSPAICFPSLSTLGSFFYLLCIFYRVRLHLHIYKAHHGCTYCRKSILPAGK